MSSIRSLSLPVLTSPDCLASRSSSNTKCMPPKRPTEACHTLRKSHNQYWISIRLHQVQSRPLCVWLFAQKKRTSDVFIRTNGDGENECNLRGVWVYNNNNYIFRPGEAWLLFCVCFLWSSPLFSPVELLEWGHDTAGTQITLPALAACEDDIPAGIRNSVVVSYKDGCVCVCVCESFVVPEWWCHYWHRSLLLDEQEQWILHLPAYSAKLGPGTAGHTAMLPGFWEQMSLEQQRL